MTHHVVVVGCMYDRLRKIERIEHTLRASIFKGAQYVTLEKYFSHPSLVMYSFAIPPKKLKLAQQIGGGTDY